jgi:hypothetical protein
LHVFHSLNTVSYVTHTLGRRPGLSVDEDPPLAAFQRRL